MRFSRGRFAAACAAAAQAGANFLESPAFRRQLVQLQELCIAGSSTIQAEAVT